MTAEAVFVKGNNNTAMVNVRIHMVFIVSALKSECVIPLLDDRIG